MMVMDCLRCRQLVLMLSFVLGADGWSDASDVLPLPDRVEQMEQAMVEHFHDLHREVRSSPTDAERWQRLGLAARANGLNSYAETCFRKAVELDPKHERAWYHLGLVLIRQTEDDAALEAMQRVIELRGDFAPPHWRIGMIQLGAGEPEAAIESFERALAIDDRDVAAHLGLARAYLDLRRPRDAARVIEEALMWARSNVAYAHLLLGRAYQQLGRRDDAARAIELGRGSEASFTDGWEQSIFAHRRGLSADSDRVEQLLIHERFDEALQLLQDLQRRYPKSPTVYSNLSATLRAMGRLQESWDVVREGLQHEPNHLQLNHNLAATAIELYQRVTDEQQKQALLTLAKSRTEGVLKQNPSYPDAHLVRGDIALQMGDLDEALDSYQTAHRYEPTNTEARFRSGVVLLHLARHDEAVEAFKQAIALRPNHHEARLGLINALIVVEDFAPAERHLAIMSEERPNDPRVQQLAALLAERKSQVGRPPTSH